MYHQSSLLRTTQNGGRRDDWDEVLFKVSASGQYGQSAGSRVSEMKLTSCFDVLYFRATGNTEMIKCACMCRYMCVRVDWWLRSQQCVDCFLPEFYRTQLALNCLQLSSWSTRLVYLFLSLFTHPFTISGGHSSCLITLNLLLQGHKLGFNGCKKVW